MASNENDIPRKGPKNAPTEISPMALWFLKDEKTELHLLRKVISKINARIPAKRRICVAKNGLEVLCIPILLMTNPVA